jgi:hypothetical protein
MVQDDKSKTPDVPAVEGSTPEHRSPVPPSTSSRLAEATRPDVPSPASEIKADTSGWPEDFKRYMDRMAIGGKRMTRFGKRWEILLPVSQGVLVANIEDSQPKMVMFLSDPQPDEYMPDDETPA